MNLQYGGSRGRPLSKRGSARLGSPFLYSALEISTSDRTSDVGLEHIDANLSPGSRRTDPWHPTPLPCGGLGVLPTRENQVNAYVWRVTGFLRNGITGVSPDCLEWSAGIIRSKLFDGTCSRRHNRANPFDTRCAFE